MTSLRSLRAKFVLSLLLSALLLLSACGTAGNSGGTQSSGNTSGNSSAGPKGPITVASKLDVENQLLAKMYTLLLQKKGFTVNEKPALGNSTIIFQAIKSGAIDLYPEFTYTALNALKMPTAHYPQKDYQTVKDAYNKQFNITWLDASPLNDGYGLCTTKDEAQKLGVTNISQLAPKVSQLVLASPSDGISFIDGLKSTYGFDTKSFKQTQTIDYALGFTAVSSDKAQVAVCYTTDSSALQKGFIFLQDDKNGFPAFNPAPIVRNSVLQKYPDIATTLNPLAPDLTTEVSMQLQSQVAEKQKAGASASKAITDVATDFLKSKGLL
ncbi:glycine/betaine ABC transporter substrate-binding protein [Ktedonosporobacter rubrisoli]|uniref:Glycine/betaine ABC transporter substrate-binding protein n=1 Tax=Ktedonosporobacter rubrisoli TaxID=2509675 RepID=A0A4P6K1Y2_KTERU|nr:glycine betaine ABC transporter substrate-binding protein [Ktedonosporobacter rubrisoli]QBD81700.1 glycine/betaine ABC transporter substrate-binding protein [Ktedonosporobacter rubrisoli]